MPGPPSTAELKARLGGRTLVLIGMMGAGKSTIGRRLAKRLGLDFLDADAEIERAAGMTIPEIFETHGEEEFRRGERAVIARLLARARACWRRAAAPSWTPRRARRSRPPASRSG